MTLLEILKLAVEKGASDVHLKVGVPPVIRKHGTLRPLMSKETTLTPEHLVNMAHEVMDDQQWEHFDEHNEIDLGYGIPGVARFRVNAFRQRGTIRMVIRNIPNRVPSLRTLRLPEAVAKLSHHERGLILVTGVAGSGKSSTIAAILSDINQTYNKHILTIEDPIEFLIRDKKSLITQREIGVDTKDFAQALRAGLRQDPDVILIGEMRDRETIEIALMAAETGHLVLSTLHTLDAAETINRILAYFEGDRHAHVRMQLGSVLRAVISQRLCRKKDESGFVPAIEILINNARAREAIEIPERTGDLRSIIEEGQMAWGMQTFDQSLMELLDRGEITYAEALLHSTNPDDFKVRVAGITAMDGKKWTTGEAVDNNSPDWASLTEVEVDMKSLIKKAEGED